MTVFEKLTLVCVAFATLTLSSCSNDKHPKRFSVTGKITFPDGEVVRTGIVEFIPLNGSLTATGTIGTDGAYSLSTITSVDGAVPGEYIVVIKQFIFYDKIPEHKHDHGGDISTAYSDERTSPFRATVNKKKNILDFEVKYADR